MTGDRNAIAEQEPEPRPSKRSAVAEAAKPPNHVGMARQPDADTTDRVAARMPELETR